MKQLSTLFILLIVSLAQSLQAHDGMINVRDYGAFGNGTDQTAEIQAAINAAAAQTLANNPSGHGGGTWLASCPTVFIPSGRYKIDGSINMASSYIHIRGDNAIFEPVDNPSDPNAPAITCSSPYRVKLSGMIFLDFVNAIKWGTSTYDVDQGLTEISNCQFVGISGTAIQYGSQSSILSVIDCRFDYPEKALHIWRCDKVVFERCWLSKTPLTEAEDHIILLEGGSIQINNSFFITAGSNTGAETAWIKATTGAGTRVNEVCITNCRFSDEANGTTLINWYVPADVTFPSDPVGIIIRDTHAEGGPSHVSGQDQSLVRLFKCPNFLHIKNNRGILNCVPMAWASGVNPTTEVFTDGANSPLNVEISGNAGNGTPASGFQVNGLPAEFVGKANLR